MDMKSIVECKETILREMYGLLSYHPGSNDRYKSFREQVFDRVNGRDSHSARNFKKEFAQFTPEKAMESIRSNLNLYKHDELVQLLINIAMNFSKQR